MMVISCRGLAAEPSAEVVVDPSSSRAEFRIHGLDLGAVEAGSAAENLVSVSVAREGEALPPMLGSYRVSGNDLVFAPRFPLDRSISRYVVSVDPSLVAASDKSRKLELLVEARFGREKSPGKTPPSIVEGVYPSRDVLPENTLKFYIAFSSPMSRGGVYSHIRLLDESGRPILDPFLELGEELWSVDGKRFTILFDPGRIKRGLKPREDVGPVLEAGKRYTLVIDSDWLDARGRPLAREYRKTFRVGSPDETMPDPQNWKVDAPRAGSREPLVIRFRESLDHALAERLILVLGPSGRAIVGTVRLEAEETVWKFVPNEPWGEGGYRIQVGTDLEDLVGNSVGRRFEVDLVEPITAAVRDSTVTIPFRVEP